MKKNLLKMVTGFLLLTSVLFLASCSNTLNDTYTRVDYDGSVESFTFSGKNVSYSNTYTYGSEYYGDLTKVEIYASGTYKTSGSSIFFDFTDCDIYEDGVKLSEGTYKYEMHSSTAYQYNFYEDMKYDLSGDALTLTLYGITQTYYAD